MNQVKEIFQCKEPLLQKYKRLVKNILLSFEKYDLEVALQSTNRFADAMASIRSLMLVNPNKKMIPIKIVQIIQSLIESDEVEHVVLDIAIEDKNLWHT